MARYGITYEEVAKAAGELIQQRQNPTVEKVRAALGSTGSFATISKHLNTWRTNYFEKQAKPITTDVIAPQEVSSVFNNAWEQLNNQAQQQIEKIKQEYNEKLTIVGQEKGQLQQEYNEIKDMLERGRVKINHLETDLKLKNQEVLELRNQMVNLQTELNSKDENLTILQTETKALTTELRHTQTEFMDAIKEQQLKQQKIHEESVKEWKILVENQRTDFMLELDKLKTAKEKLEKLNTKLETELQQHAIRYKAMEEHNRALATDLSITSQHKEELERQLTTFKVASDYKKDVEDMFKKIYGELQQIMQEKQTNTRKRNERDIKKVTQE